MIWRPTQANGWNPRLSAVGDRIFVLYGAGDVWVAELTLDMTLVRERQLAAGGAFPMGWIQPGVATWQVEDGQDRAARFQASYVTDWAVDLMPDDRGAVAGNIGVADGGHWATWLAAPHFRTVIDGRGVASGAGGALTMAWPWVAHASTNDNLFIRRYRDGSVVPPDLPTLAPMNFLTVGRQGHVAYGSGGLLYATGPNGVDLGSQMVTPWRWEVPIRIVDISGVPNLVTFSFDGTDAMFLIRPFGARQAKVVRIWATNGDVLQVGDRLVVAGSGARGELSVLTMSATQPTEALTPKMEPLPLGFVAWFYDTGKYRPTDNRPPRRGTFTGRNLYADGDGNVPGDWGRRMVQSIIDAGAGLIALDSRDKPEDTLAIVRPIWHLIHGIWIHEPGNDQIDAACRNARALVKAAGLDARPIILVIATDAVLAADYNPNNTADWVAPECYEPALATVDDWASAAGRMSRLIQRVLAATAPKPVILIGQCYDRRSTPDRPPSGFSAEALEAYQPATFAAWRANPGRVKGVGLFADLRPGGAIDHPENYGWAAAAVKASPGLPAIEVPGVQTGGGEGGTRVSPKITIEGAWPVRVDVDAGGKARVRAVAKITAGQVDRFEWRIRPVGGSWSVVARNPASDLDHHFEVGVGEYQIGLDAFGIDGRDSTGADRRIVVTQKVVAPPDPIPDPKPEDPTPAPGDQVVRFLAPNGAHYLTALNGGGTEGETFQGKPAGLITAHVPTRDVGGWQDFTLRGGKRKGTFGLRTVNGGWVSLQADNSLVGNVHRPADYRPEGRQAFILVDIGGGKLGIQGANGRFLAALNAGGGDVVVDRETAKDWERWTPSVTITIPDLEAEPTRVDRALVGLVRPFGRRGIRDDVGPFLATTLSRFYVMHAWATDRDRVLREFDMDAKYGYCPRIMAEVGTMDDSGFWDAQGWNPDDPRTQQMIADITDAADARGIKVQWTAIGKGPTSRSRDQRRSIVERVGAALRDRNGVLFGEVMNEPPAGWDGPDKSELQDLVQAFDEASGRRFLMATGSVWTSNDATGFSVDAWRETQAMKTMGDRAVGIAHTDRDTSKSEEQDRPWRQTWDIGLEGDRWCDNEGIGLGSSVRSEGRPAVLRSHRLVAHIARAAASCLHGSPGVRGLERWEDQAAYHEAWKSRRFLDPDIVNGQPFNANSKFPGRPFELPGEFIRADTGNSRGIVRCYTVQAPNGVFYSVPFGPVDYTYPNKGAGAGSARLIAQRALTVTAYQQDLGVQVWERTVNEGEVIDIDSRFPDLLLISR